MRGRQEGILRAAQVQEEGREDYRRLTDAVGSCRLVLLGEGSHGTHDFYRVRAEITREFITRHGFMAVAAEADWPDALQIDGWVRGWPPRRPGRDQGGAAALRGFGRFPAWMWRNAEVLEFVEWLRGHNDALPPGEPRVGFYGLDLYTPTLSEQPGVQEASPRDPGGAPGASPRSSRAAGLEAARDEEVGFHEEQAARLARNAARYFEALSAGEPLSWNLRERHMDETLQAILEHLQHVAGKRRPVKVAVWVHNSHAGDASATQMAVSGELSLGQLARERHGPAAALVGFTTYEGTVLAASGWGRKVEEKVVRPAHPQSFEALFHQLGARRFYLPLTELEVGLLDEPRLERAIGAVYLPDAELENHYFQAELTRQFDHLFHFDQTRAVSALDPLAGQRAIM